MTGSAGLFADTSWLFADVAHRGPGYVQAHPDHAHYCARMGQGDGLVAGHGGSGLHVVYRGQWPEH